MGFPIVFSSQVTPPVVILSQRPKSGDLHDSFGSDFERLGQTSPIASKSPSARPWRACPERARSVPGGMMQVSYGAWLADSGRDCYAVMGMKAGAAAPGPVGDALRNWRTSFLADVNAGRRFEGDRHDALRDIGWGSQVTDTPRLRAFPMGAFQAQASAVAGLSTWIAQRSASDTSSTPVEIPAANGAAAEATSEAAAEAAMLEHATELRDTMFLHTAKSILNRLSQLTCERRDLFLLNEMTREAEDLVGKAGEQVPLRLAVRGDKCVLKPAKSRSMFPVCTQRARREAAALAMMLGYSPNETITLETLRSQGFGRHESTVLLGDARWTGVDMASDEPWLFGRIRELESAKRSGFALLDTIRESAARPYRAGGPALVVDDSAVDVMAEASLGNTGELLLPEDGHEPVRAVSRQAVPSEGVHRRGSSVDDLTPDELTPPQTPGRDVIDGRTPRQTGRAFAEFARTMVDAGPQRTRAQRQVVFADAIATEGDARASSPPPPLGRPLAQSSPYYESPLEHRVTRHYQQHYESPSPIALASPTSSSPPPPYDRPGTRRADDVPHARRQDKFEEEADRVLAWHRETGEKAKRRPHVASVLRLPPVLSMKTLRTRHGAALRAAEALSTEMLQQKAKVAERARSRDDAAAALVAQPARSPADAPDAPVAPDVPPARVSPAPSGPSHMSSMPPIRE